MTALPLIIAVSFSAVIVSVYAYNYQYFAVIAKHIKNSEAFSIIDAAEIASRLDSARTIDGPSLKDDALREAFEKLLEYARDFKPDWIVGVHPGGRLLSVLLTEHLGLAQNRCIYVGMYSSKQSEFCFQPDPTSVAGLVSGRMLIVDDIVRSGRTVNNLKSYLAERNYEGRVQISNVSFACLVVAVPSSRAENLLFPPDWFNMRTDNDRLRLPWSGVGAAFERQYARLASLPEREGKIDEGVVAFYERLVSDFSYASRLAQLCLAGEVDLASDLEDKQPSRVYSSEVDLDGERASFGLVLDRLAIAV